MSDVVRINLCVATLASKSDYISVNFYKARRHAAAFVRIRGVIANVHLTVKVLVFVLVATEIRTSL